ncbi:unnamed protein product [Rhizophagus irregularis]|nr:unnamed protein product [Rhizophagus irregularis]
MRLGSMGYHASWKNNGLALDKSIVTRLFNDKVEWFIKNDTSLIHREIRAYLFWEEEMFTTKLRNVEKGASLASRQSIIFL